MSQPQLQAVQPEHQIFIDSLRPLGAKTRTALYSIYAFVDAAQGIANNRDADQALSELNDFRRQTDEVLESGRSSNPILKSFAATCKTYKIDTDCVDELFKSLKMQVTNDTYNVREYKAYIRGAGEAVGVMVLQVLFYKRAVLAHKLTPAARGLGAAICKVMLLQTHGETHKKHGRMHFPDVTKGTFNQARLAQVLVDIESDFRAARSGIPGLPSGTRTAVAVIYVYYYDILGQMRGLSPADIDAGKAKVTSTRKLWLATRTYLAPLSSLERGKLS